MAKEKKHKRLSIDELRNFTGFENYTDEEAEATIKTLETLSILYYELFMKEKSNEHSLTIKDQKNETDYKTELRTAA